MRRRTHENFLVAGEDGWETYLRDVWGLAHKWGLHGESCVLVRREIVYHIRSRTAQSSFVSSRFAWSRQQSGTTMPRIWHLVDLYVCGTNWKSFFSIFYFPHSGLASVFDKLCWNFVSSN